MEQETITIAIIVISAIFIMVALFVIVYIIRFTQKKRMLIEEKETQAADFQHQLLQSQTEVQEATYNVVAKELHDNVGQLLSSAKMLVGLAERDLPDPPDTLLTANATLGQAISELRSLSRSLDKEWLEQFSFTENLNAEVSRNNAGNAVSASFINDAEINLPTGEQIILFRIVQEAMQNAIKHAAPTAIIVTSEKENDQLIISIRDNGSGFSPDHATKGMGLNNMQHRTKLLGGNISWKHALPKGTIVTISLPSKKTQA